MVDDVVRQHFLMVERHVTEAEEHVRRQREIIARLDAKGLGRSATAGLARDLLRQMEENLALHLAERKRLHK